jgi:branched-chain amino acid transport system ATP-binding protein
VQSHVLHGVSIAVHRGETVGLLGRNGMGKTTLIRTLLGLVPASRGQVFVDGEDVTQWRTEKVVVRGIGYVPEGRRVYKDLSVKENLEMGAYPKSARGRLKESLEHVIRLFPALGQRQQQLAGTLSGGEQQMLAIGRALMSRPKLLLVDELSLGLAPMITKSIYRTLSALGAGITLLLVEQNVEQALSFSQRAYIFESGRITRSGLSADLMQDADIRRAYLGL